MKLRKGKWKYPLPTDTHEIMRAFLQQNCIAFALQYIRPIHLMDMRQESKKKNGGKCIQGHVAYISMLVEDKGISLLVFPEPHESAELKLTATRIFEQ